MKSSSASSEGTFYYWSVPLLSMEMNDCVIHRSHCTPEQIEVPSTKSTNRLQRHCKAVPHTVWGGRGQDMVPSTEQNRFTTPIPKHSALPGNASSLLTPLYSRDESRDISDMIACSSCFNPSYKGKKSIYYKSYSQKGGCSVFQQDENICHYMTFRQPLFFFITYAMLGIMSLPGLQVL